MKKLVVPVLILVLTQFAQAGPLVPADIAADAKWFAHVDVAAVRSSKVCAACKDQICRQGCEPKCLRQLAAETGIDPTQDILGVSAYATQYEGDDMVVIIYCNDVDADRLHAFVKQQDPDCQTKELAGTTVCRWVCKRMKPPMPVVGTVVEDDMIVLSNSESMLAAALGVLNAQKPGLKEGAALLKGVDVRKAFFVAQAIDVPEAYREVTTCPVLRKCTAAFVQWIGEGDRIIGHYRLTADSEEDALRFKAICDGFRAMLEIKYDDVDAVESLLEGAKSRVEGNLFLAKITTTEEVIIGVLGAMVKRKHGIE